MLITSIFLIFLLKKEDFLKFYRILLILIMWVAYFDLFKNELNNLKIKRYEKYKGIVRYENRII